MLQVVHVVARAVNIVLTFMCNDIIVLIVAKAVVLGLACAAKGMPVVVSYHGDWYRVPCAGVWRAVFPAGVSTVAHSQAS